MAYSLINVDSEEKVQEFIDFQYELYKNDPLWVPAMKNDEFSMICYKKNPAYNHCEAKFWFVESKGKVLGRIGAIINHRYNKDKQIKVGRINRFECIDDFELAQFLFGVATSWMSENGMEKAMGPLGFNNLDQQGLLIEGFEHLPSVGSVYHKNYYHDFFLKMGFRKEIDWVEFRLTVGKEAQEKALRGAELLKKRNNISVRHFSKQEELKSYGNTIFDIINDSFDVLPFVSRFDDKLKDFYSKKYMSFLNPNFVKIAEIDSQPIGFVIGMPSMSVAMQKAKGKLLPFGFYHLLKARKGNTDTLDQLLTGVRKQFHSTGAAVVLQAELQKEMLKRGMKYIETTGIFENNEKAITNWKNYEHIQHKRRRTFTKDL